MLLSAIKARLSDRTGIGTWSENRIFYNPLRQKGTCGTGADSVQLTTISAGSRFSIARDFPVKIPIKFGINVAMAGAMAVRDRRPTNAFHTGRSVLAGKLSASGAAFYKNFLALTASRQFSFYRCGRLLMTGIRKAIAGLIFFLAFAGPGPVLAAGKAALVIGNGAYQAMPALRNPANDANLISAKLVELGFDVVRIIDGNRQDFWDGLKQFGRKAQGADVALVFYAGHGVQVNGRNWLLPVDAEIEASTDLPAQALKANDLLEIMEASGAKLKLVFLDACRNNPLPRSLSRGAANGLARLEANAAGMMIAFATSPGDVALDGSGNNSPFTEALARLIDTPDLEVRHLMGKVRESVYVSTGERQLPWLNEALIGEFYFGGQSSEAAAPATQSDATTAKVDSGSAAQTAPLVASRAEPTHLPTPPYHRDLCQSVRDLGGTVEFCASSILDPQFGNRYGPGNLFDQNPSTAWVEGVRGDGAGQKILIAFDRPRRVAGFQITNGYAKNRDIYRKNARVRTAMITLSDGSTQSVSLPDDMRANRFTFGAPQETTWLEFEIGSVFAGARYSDTAVSELIPIFAD